MSEKSYEQEWGLSAHKDGYSIKLSKVPSWEYAIRSLLMQIVGDRCCRWLRGYPSRIFHQIPWCMWTSDQKHEIISIPITDEQARVIAPGFVGMLDDLDGEDEEGYLHCPECGKAPTVDLDHDTDTNERAACTCGWKGSLAAADTLPTLEV